MGLVACGSPQVRSVDAEAAQRAAQLQSELDQAVRSYHETSELGPLQAWVDRNPDHPEYDVWREVVALRIYESLVIGDPWEGVPAEEGDDPAVATLPEPSVSQLVSVVERYPDTIAAVTAQAVLEEDGLRRLTQPPFNDSVVAFLEGRDDWVRDPTGRVMMPNVDLEAFRERHESSLRQRLGERLVEDRCAQKMGYCTWWVQNFPQESVTAGVQQAMKEEWYRRGHPPWRGKRYANCAYRCAKACRSDSEPLDDACYEPCFEGCG